MALSRSHLLRRFLCVIGPFLCSLFALSASSERRTRFFVAPVPESVPSQPVNRTLCNYQSPQRFLIRSNYIPLASISREEQLARSKLHRKAIAYRTKRYGYFEGFGRPNWNRQTPIQNAFLTKFMGIKVALNRHIVPLIACVEEQLTLECTSTPYQPQRISGIREYNTFRSREVSNHVYGIAIDIDPARNICCGCLRHFRKNHLCRRPVKSIFDRMEMPECWVHVFERFGFYWLGRDALQDTMHFEFLGDPEEVLRGDIPGPDRKLKN